MKGLELLIANDLQDVTLSGINTKITIEEGRKTASIEKPFQEVSKFVLVKVWILRY